ncbi:RNA polymerase sigma factor [Nocardioides sp. T2.26MG-1]|uniref:RNA polymerase sigma factor n=1 Tax=Nocardioides sp. T2.26MG-1 TaxID=3041166 RepID=UPI00247789DD|nr:RNA polymerase sigma factor [Nocardioides sp. T2.26MG-1]CAI9412684.1 ECF RNA polymerase sigma factor SigE [Nocardioides sp. T2.26MG-1]
MKPFDDVVAEHGATVLRVCRAALAQADADDAWAETFVSAMRAYPSLPADANVEAWLVAIAHHKIIDTHRATRRRPVPVDVLPESGTEPGPGPGEHDALYDALKRLPDKQRHAVAYHHLGGLSHREVATVLGGTEAAARRASADGIKALRRTYQQERAHR